MSKQTGNKFSPEVRSRAVRVVLDQEAEHRSRWTAIMSIAAKIGCTPQTLLDWVRKAEVDSGKRAGVPTDMAEKLKALERENRELRQANEILRKASAHWGAAPTNPRGTRRKAPGIGDGGPIIAIEGAQRTLSGRQAKHAPRVNKPSKITGVEKAERTPFSAKKAKHDTRVGVRNTPVIAVEESRRDVAPRNVSTGLSAPQNYRIW